MVKNSLNPEADCTTVTCPQILRTLSAKSLYENVEEDILTNLSFSHFIELTKADSNSNRSFYEVYTIKTIGE